MNLITLYIKDLKLASELSDHLTVLDSNVEIHDEVDDLSIKSKLVFIDLDENDFGNVDFISSLNSFGQDIIIVGFMSSVHKDTIDKYKAAGCRMVLTKSSAVKNIANLVNEFAA